MRRGTAQYSQATALAVGTAPPATNTSVCSIAFNDTIIPYSGYNVSLISSSGNAYPGWPQAWQLNGGLNGTVNISQGAPFWNGVIVYPQPIVAQPLNNGPQSIAGNLNMSGYNIVNVGSLGVGTVTPSWPIDVENGGINASGGYLFNGAAPVNHVLLGNGSYYVDSATIPASIISGMGDNYQTAQSNGAAQPQEPAYNFSTAFALSDNSGAATNVGLANSGVTAGTFTNPTLTVGADGRVTSATSEAAIPTIQKLQVTTGICSTANTVSYSSCSFAATWPVAFADANYAVTCTARTPNVPGLTAIWTEAETAAGFNIYLQNGTSNGAVAVTVAEVDCIGVHP